MKKCTKCHKEKPLSEFHKCTREKSGHKSACKECRNKAHVDYNARNPDKKREYREANRESLNAWRRVWAKNNPDKEGAFLKRQPPEYKVWIHMRERCNNPNNTSAKYYHDKGIKVCERWNSFANFYADMGSRPTADHQIDRIDSDGDYRPDNCRWVTPKVNVNNRGAYTSRANLTKLEIAAIFFQHEFGRVEQAELARDYNISHAHLNFVINHKARRTG